MNLALLIMNPVASIFQDCSYVFTVFALARQLFLRAPFSLEHQRMTALYFKAAKPKKS